MTAGAEPTWHEIARTRVIPSEPAVRDAAAVQAKYDATIREVFLDENATHRRPPGLSLSGLGGCTKAAAYALAAVEPSDDPRPDEARAAALGTHLHEWLLTRVAAALPGAVIELPVVLHAGGIEIPGRLDLHDPDGVFEGKSVGERRLHGVRRAGPFADHRLQALGYGLAALQAGLPVPFVTWLYIDRATGDHETIVEPFTNRAALDVLDRVRRIAQWAETPDQAPREGRGPGLSLACDSCHWLTRCRGAEAVAGRVGAQRRLAHDEPSTAQLLALFDDASRRRGEASKDYEFAKAALADAQWGSYGPWTLRRSKANVLLVGLTASLSKSQRKSLAAGMADDTED